MKNLFLDLHSFMSEGPFSCLGCISEISVTEILAFLSVTDEFSQIKAYGLLRSCSQLSMPSFRISHIAGVPEVDGCS